MNDDSETIIVKNLCLNSRANSGSAYTFNPKLSVYLISIELDNTTSINSNFSFILVAATDKTFMTFKYYNFYVNNVKYIGINVLEVDADPIYGDSDLYTAKDLPGNKVATTSENYKWRSMRFGEDNYAIPINNNNDSHICIYSYSTT